MVLRIVTAFAVLVQVYWLALRLFLWFTRDNSEARRAYVDNTFFGEVLPTLAALVMLMFFVVLFTAIWKLTGRLDGGIRDTKLRVARLERLRASGVISDEEYRRERQRIVGEA
jgi:uncharacterized membrane protein